MSLKLSHSVLAVTALGLVFVSAPACASDGWGAIAIDVTQSSAAPSFGVGGGANEDEASGNAIKFCHETGSKTGCKIMVTYQACGAIASNGSDAGWAKAPSKDEAEKSAIKSCGKDSCKLVTSDCN